MIVKATEALEFVLCKKPQSLSCKFKVLGKVVIESCAM